MPFQRVTLYCFIPLLNGQKESLYRNCVKSVRIGETSSLHALFAGGGGTGVREPVSNGGEKSKGGGRRGGGRRDI